LCLPKLCDRPFHLMHSFYRFGHSLVVSRAAFQPIFCSFPSIPSTVVESFTARYPRTSSASFTSILILTLQSIHSFISRVSSVRSKRSELDGLPLLFEFLLLHSFGRRGCRVLRIGHTPSSERRSHLFCFQAIPWSSLLPRSGGDARTL
jgi:hypothetical protein